MYAWTFVGADGKTAPVDANPFKKHASKYPNTDPTSKEFKAASKRYYGRGEVNSGQMQSIFGMSLGAKLAGVGKDGWNASNFSKFQRIFNNDPKLGLRTDIDYSIFLRTKEFTPWDVELFLKQMERNAVTVGIHKDNDRRRIVTPSWNFKRWYGQLPYWASDYIKGDFDTTIDEQVDADLDAIFGPLPGKKARTASRKRKIPQPEYFNPWGKEEEHEYTRSEWRNQIPSNAKFIPSSDGISYWALYNPRVLSQGKSNAFLGVMLEFGDLRGQPPKPWIRPAIEENLDTIRGIWTDCIRNTFRGALEVGNFGPWIQVGGPRPLFFNNGDGKNPLFKGWDRRSHYAPSIAMGEKFYRGKADKQSAIFSNMFREMLQQHKPLLIYLEHTVKEYLLKIDEPSEFTQDYKRAGGMSLTGGRFIDMAPSDLEPGSFTGQLYQAIAARWESSPTILQR